jgi:23S rRNA pseudouridine1911/1915/1917 synthase
MKFKTETSGERLDLFLSDKFKLSRNRIQGLIKDSKVLVNNKPTVSSHQIKPGEEIDIEFDEAKKKVFAQIIPIEIIYEDDDVIVVNKPAGMVAHPAYAHPDGTLYNAVAGHAKEAFVPYLVHRLDKDTSGAIVIAKNLRARNSLIRQFGNRSVKKLYRAAVKGNVLTKEGRIEAPLGRSPHDRKKIVVGPMAKKEAVTEFKTVFRSKHYSLLEVSPITGRTHQIRSHLTFIGHPVLGDKTYGGPETLEGKTFARQMLHAFRLSFIHPTRQRRVTFEAEMPADISQIWNRKIS